MAKRRVSGALTPETGATPLEALAMDADALRALWARDADHEDRRERVLTAVLSHPSGAEIAGTLEPPLTAAERVRVMKLRPYLLGPEWRGARCYVDAIRFVYGVHDWGEFEVERSVDPNEVVIHFIRLAALEDRAYCSLFLEEVCRRNDRDVTDVFLVMVQDQLRDAEWRVVERFYRPCADLPPEASLRLRHLACVKRIRSDSGSIALAGAAEGLVDPLTVPGANPQLVRALFRWRYCPAPPPPSVEETVADEPGTTDERRAVPSV